MRRPLRPCKQFGCKNTVIMGYCDIHRKRYKSQNIKAKKDYDRMRPSAHDRGYDSTWNKFRKYYLRKHPICDKCRSLAQIPHHIISLKDGGSKYNEDNIMPLCRRCHNIIHHIKFK